MKVYLSKSNACNYRTYRQVRELLDTLDCEVLEYTGGSYSNVDVLRSDMMIVIPPDYTARIKHGDAKKVNIGRGQYDQIHDFFEINYDALPVSHIMYEPKSDKIVLMVSHIEESGSVYVDEVKGLKRSPEDDWKLHWADAIDFDMQINITNYLHQRKYANRGLYKDKSTGVINLPTQAGKSISSKIVPHLACRNLFK